MEFKRGVPATGSMSSDGKRRDGGLGRRRATPGVAPGAMASSSGVSAPQLDESHKGNVATLAQLVDTDLTAAIRLILDRSWTTSYDTLLTEYAKRQENMIRQLCGTHYQDFVSSVESLVNVKFAINKLKVNIRGYNESVQQSGSNVIEAVETLMPKRHIKKRIERAIDVLRDCSERVRHLQLAQQRIANRQYVQALGTLDRLKTLQAERSYESKFSEHLSAVVERLRKEIKSRVRAEYDAWLKRVPSMARQIGMLVFSHRAAQNSSASGGPSRGGRGDASDRKRAPSTPTRPRDAEKGGSGDGAVGSDSLSFSANSVDEKARKQLHQIQDSIGALHQSLHVNQLLSREDLDGLIRYSQINREKTGTKLARQAEKLNVKVLFKNREKYFADLYGFFVIQEATYKSPLGSLLLSQAGFAQLWAKICKFMEAAVTRMFEALQSPRAWKDLKASVKRFMLCLSDLGLHSEPLVEFVNSKSVAYRKLLISQFDKDVKEIVSKDHFEPLQIKTQSMYEQFVAPYQLEDEDAPRRKYPTTMSFSLSVPLICKAITGLIRDFFAFQEQETGVVDPYHSIMHVIDDALVTTVCKRLRPPGRLPRSQITQLIVNCEHLAKACDYFEQLAFKMVEEAYPSLPVHTKSVLKAKAKLENLQMEFNLMMVDELKGKIEALLDLGSMDWKPKEIIRSPFAAFDDLIGLLEGTFASLFFLPSGLREAAHIQALSHVSVVIRTFWREEMHSFNIIGNTTATHIHADVGSAPSRMAKKSTDARARLPFLRTGMRNFDISLRALEEFTNRSTVPDMIETLSTIRQVVDIIVKERDIKQVADSK